MGKKKISFGLSEAEIDRAIKELDEYKKDIQKKTELFREKVAERLAQEAQAGFDASIVSDLVGGGGHTAQVSVTVRNDEKISVVIANGADAVWVEFGAGVYHNGSAGSSPHPKGEELGMIIGGYGKGYGKQKAWGYYEDGVLTVSRGTPATMPMYRAMTTVCNEISKIAEEVFG